MARHQDLILELESGEESTHRHPQHRFFYVEVHGGFVTKRVKIIASFQKYEKLDDYPGMWYAWYKLNTKKKQ